MTITFVETAASVSPFRTIPENTRAIVRSTGVISYTLACPVIMKPRRTATKTIFQTLCPFVPTEASVVATQMRAEIISDVIVQMDTREMYVYDLEFRGKRHIRTKGVSTSCHCYNLFLTLVLGFLFVIASHTYTNQPIQHCELTEGQSVPDFMTASSIRSNRNSSSSDNGNKTLVATLSATMAFLAAVALIAVFVVVKRRRNGMIHSIASPRSIREADSTQLDADGEVLKDSFRATTSGELYSPGSNVSQISKRKTLDPAVDMTEEVEFGEEEGHV